eukprot:1717415-Pyramimonas_sp.AAC.1
MSSSLHICPNRGYDLFFVLNAKALGIHSRYCEGESRNVRMGSLGPPTSRISEVEVAYGFVSASRDPRDNILIRCNSPRAGTTAIPLLLRAPPPLVAKAEAASCARHTCVQRIYILSCGR